MKRFDNSWKIVFSMLTANGCYACAFLTENIDWIIPAFILTLATAIFAITNRARKVSNAR